MTNATVSSLIQSLYEEAKRQRDAKEISQTLYDSILEKIGEVQEEFAEM